MEPPHNQLDPPDPSELTDILRRWRRGDREAGSEALSQVYDELRRIALNHFRNEGTGHTLEPTAVVHEAYIRLMKQGGVSFQNRAHFVGCAARLMRQVLIDHSRLRDSLKRGGDRHRVTLSGLGAVDGQSAAGTRVDLIDLDSALDRLEQLDPLKVSIVELRYFGGLTLEETADQLDVSAPTVKRHWRRARAWLFREISK